ncbi:NAD(P)/FAD-dependent oxidoreductase [Dehalogenimonas sp. THU2]|uniref:NAD(P)/FAD-dependent oxidoreductase n=1 Tax=Dehalogenimonas sp. THU2 TaxID=3151121 RepID=UPI0032185FC7
MMQNSMADVIIVGAGPAGSRVAFQLGSRNHDVILLEKRRTLGEPVCCTGIVSPECLAEFKIDTGLILRRFSGARVHSPSGETIHIKRSTTQAIIIDRAAFDREMTEKACAAGARLELGSTVNCIEILPDRVVVHALRNQEPCQFTARSVVIAAGLTQKLTTQLGVGAVKDFAVGVQLDVEGAGITELEVFLGASVAPGFFAWKVPTSPGQAKLGMIVRDHPVEHMQAFTDLLNKVSGTIAPVGRPVCRPIPLARLEKTFGERLLVVGDAAGQVKTTTGGGLYYGLLCADLAANTLHEALLRDTLQAGYLKSYEKAWHRRLRRDMFLGKLARNFILEHGDRHLDNLIRKTHQSGLLKRLLDDDRLSFDWHGAAFLEWATGLFRR